MYIKILKVEGKKKNIRVEKYTNRGKVITHNRGNRLFKERVYI
jgi:hypothetical protein